MPHFHTVTQINEIKNKTSYDLLYLVIKKQKKKKKKGNKTILYSLFPS